MTDERWIGDIEARLEMVEGEVGRLRDFRHEITDRMLVPLQSELHEIKTLIKAARTTTTTTTTHERGNGEDRHLTMRDFYLVSGALIAGFMSAMWLMHS